MKSPAPEIIEMDPAQFEELMRRAEQGTFAEEDYPKIRGVLESYYYVIQLVDKKSTTIARLRKLLFGVTTEKTADLVGREAAATATNSDQETNLETGTSATASSAPAEEEPPKIPGHG